MFVFIFGGPVFNEMYLAFWKNHSGYCHGQYCLRAPRLPIPPKPLVSQRLRQIIQVMDTLEAACVCSVTQEGCPKSPLCQIFLKKKKRENEQATLLSHSLMCPLADSRVRPDRPQTEPASLFVLGSPSKQLSYRLGLVPLLLSQRLSD